MSDPAYNKIGKNYAGLRRPDRRIAALLAAHSAGLETILNVGCGTGSYEPDEADEKRLVALDPSWRMIEQRSSHAAPCVGGRAEALPFADRTFDGAMAILTIHHWDSITVGLDEMKRVTRKRLLILTWDPDAADKFWLTRDYFPEIIAFDLGRFPPIETVSAHFSQASLVDIPIPHDCTDGFMGAYWRRPEAYLDDSILSGMSTFQQIPPPILAHGLKRLRHDLRSGAWTKRYHDLVELEALDLGYRLIVARP